jgi:hypothetical protein
MNYWQTVYPNDWDVLISISRKEKSRCSCVTGQKPVGSYEATSLDEVSVSWELFRSWHLSFQDFLGSTVQSSWTQGFLNPIETCCRMFQIGDAVHHKSFACPDRHGQTSMPRARLNSVLPLYRMPINSSTPAPLRDPNYTCKAIPVQALRFPWGWGSQISLQSAHEVVMLSPYA